MRKNLLKTLLVAVGLVMGVNAWAEAGDVTTNVDIDFSNAITDGVVTGTKGSMTIGSGDGISTTITDGILYVGNSANTVSIPEKERAGEKDIVTFSFEMGTADGKDNYGAFNMKDANGNIVAELVYAHWEGTAGSINKTNLGITLGTTLFYKNSTNPKDVNWDKRTFFTITFDYKNKTITTVTQINGSNALAPVTVSMTNTEPIAEFNLYSGTTTGGGGEARRPKFDNLKITTTKGDYTTQTAEYTIKYLCNGVELKEATKRTGDVGAAIELTATDKEDFISEDGSLKYKYLNDDCTDKTIAEDGSTVITINFTSVEKVETAKVSYTYNGTSIKEEDVALNNAYEDDVITIPFRYIVVDKENNTVYKTTNNPKDPYYGDEVTITKDLSIGKTLSILYNNVDIVLFEDLDGSTGNNAEIRASNQSAYDNKVYTSAFEIEAGTYDIMIRAQNRGRGSNITIGDDVAIELSTLSKNSWVDFTQKDITTTGGLVNLTKGGSNTVDCLDIILIMRTKSTVSIGEAGLATYSPAVGLDFTNAENIEAYKATVNAGESTVILTKVNTVAAGEGVLLRSIAGDAATENIPVAVDAQKNDGNDFVGVETDIESLATETDGYTNYILNNVDGVIGFYKAAGNSVAAGKAYLQVLTTAANAKSLKIVFGDTTGISEINNTAKADGAYYSISGVRVANPTKGLYIQNGKKVIVK